MLGVQVLILVAIFLVVGFEAGSPGTTLAVLHAVGVTVRSFNEHLVPGLCTELRNVGQSAGVCATI